MSKKPINAHHEKTRHGKRVWVYREGKGKRTRLPDEFGTPEWWNAYKAALAGQEITVRPNRDKLGTLKWLIARYMESATWAGYSDGTRKQRSNIFRDTIERANNPRIVDIDKIAIQQAMERRARTPAQANNFLKAMKGLFDWSLINGHVEENPTIGIKNLNYKSKGFTAWTVPDYLAFCERWPIGTKPRLALELYLYSGLRRGDLHLAGPQHLTGSTFSIRNQKTGIVVTMDFPEVLMETINATETDPFRFVTKTNGDPFASKESMGNWFGDRCRDAGLKLNGHGLRKLSATLVAEGGGSVHALMAQYGWTNAKQAEHYTKEANRKDLGRSSSGVLADQIENKISPHLEKGKGK